MPDPRLLTDDELAAIRRDIEQCQRDRRPGTLFDARETIAVLTQLLAHIDALTAPATRARREALEEAASNVAVTARLLERKEVYQRNLDTAVEALRDAVAIHNAALRAGGE